MTRFSEQTQVLAQCTAHERIADARIEVTFCQVEGASTQPYRAWAITLTVINKRAMGAYKFAGDAIVCDRKL